jgi:hypothetical protein
MTLLDMTFAAAMILAAGVSIWVIVVTYRDTRP